MSPRLDDGCGLGGWRNGLLFDPFKKYGEWSYMDIMVDPLIRALRTAMTPDTKVTHPPGSTLQAAMCVEGERRLPSSEKCRGFCYTCRQLMHHSSHVSHDMALMLPVDSAFPEIVIREQY